MLECPNLNEVVIEALQFHSSYPLPKMDFGAANRRLVIGSGNALPTGRIMFMDEDAVFANEGEYLSALKRIKSIDSSVVISSSGKKHAPGIITYLLDQGLNPYLLTCDGNSPAAQVLREKTLGSHVMISRSQDEPLTYNTFSYLGMILAKTREDPKKVLDHIRKQVYPAIPDDLSRYRSVYMIIPPEFEFAKEMFVTKFDELFVPKVSGRCYTTEQSRHAKTLNTDDSELFISLGYKNRLFGEDMVNRWDITLPESIGYAGMIAIGYYVIGHIQQQNKPYFKENVQQFEQFQKKMFDENFFADCLQKFNIKD